MGMKEKGRTLPVKTHAGPSGLTASTTDPWPTLEDAIATAEVIAEHARRVYGDLLEGVWLYGSRARADHRPDSDLDLLVVRTSKESDPRNRLSRVLWDAMMSDPRFGEDDHDGLYDAPLGWRVSIHAGFSEQFWQWDTMFYRNVRSEAIRVI